MENNTILFHPIPQVLMGHQRTQRRGTGSILRLANILVPTWGGHWLLCFLRCLLLQLLLRNRSGMLSQHLRLDRSRDWNCREAFLEIFHDLVEFIQERIIMVVCNFLKLLVETDWGPVLRICSLRSLGILGFHCTGSRSGSIIRTRRRRLPILHRLKLRDYSESFVEW